MKRLLKLLLKLVAKLLFRVKIEGLEGLDLSCPTILMPNHVSLIDGVLLMLYLPERVTFVVNTGIAKRFAPLLKLVRFIAVDPLNPYSVRQMVRVIQNGTPLVIFPEGRVTTTGGFMKVFSGVGYIAMKTRAALYPVAIDGAERSKFSYLNKKWKTRWFQRVHIRIGRPFRLEPNPEHSAKRQKEEAAERIFRTLQEQLLATRLKPQVNLFNELWDTARTNGTKFTICEDITASVTYNKLLISTYALSRKLSRKLAEDAAVGLLLPNALGQVVALFSLFYLGKTPALLNFSAGRQNLLDACETASLRTILTSRQFIEKGKMQPVIEALSTKAEIVYLEDVRAGIGFIDKLAALAAYMLKKRAKPANGEVILFTSGSENKPKGVVLTHENLYANMQQLRCALDFTSDDKLLNALPMFHSFGLTVGTLLPLLYGMRLFLYPSPLHYRVIPEIAYDKSATILLGTSTFLAGYGRQAHPYDFYRMRYIVAGGEKLKEEVRQLWQEKFGIRILEGYGTTETAPVLSLNTPMHYRKGTVGRFLPGIRYEIQSVEGIEEGGNLLVRGPNLMKGYLIYGKGFVPHEGWYDCGDVVKLDPEGYISIQSRLKRFAKIGGEMVSLNLVEELAENCYPGAALAAVNAPDPRKGERIVLFHNRPDLHASALKQAFAERGYAPLLAPAAVAYMEKLPLLGSGKTDYVALKQQAILFQEKERGT